MSASVRRKKKSKKTRKNGNGRIRRKNNRTAAKTRKWKPPTGKELKKLQKDWDHVT